MAARDGLRNRGARVRRDGAKAATVDRVCGDGAKTVTIGLKYVPMSSSGAWKAGCDGAKTATTDLKRAQASSSAVWKNSGGDGPMLDKWDKLIDHWTLRAQSSDVCTRAGTFERHSRQRTAGTSSVPTLLGLSCNLVTGLIASSHWLSPYGSSERTVNNNNNAIWRGSDSTVEEPPPPLWGVEACSPPSRRPNPIPAIPAWCRQDTTSPWSTDYGGNVYGETLIQMLDKKNK